MNLRELLSYQNPRMEEYDRIIAGTRCRDWTCTVPCADLRTRRLKRNHNQLLQEKLSGRLLVDLGCGTNMASWEKTAELAMGCKARAYLGVDRFFSPEEELYKSLAPADATAEYASTELILVCGDMLKFLAMLPDNSANFTINNIDAAIISSKHYLSAVTDELERATVPGGIVFGACSVPLSYLSQDLFCKVEPSYHDPNSGLFVKKAAGEGVDITAASLS